ncbi:MAG: STAS domain-containing protein [Treponema sp.]|jgi:anti-anti-sigma factor|nr:STAS domain-containing protein [Treponema sp.]
MEYVTKVGENAEVLLAGKLAFDKANVLMDELRSLENKGVKSIDFFCKDLEYISSAGIRAIIFAKQKIDRNVEMILRLHNVKPEVFEVFSMSGIEQYLEFID